MYFGLDRCLSRDGQIRVVQGSGEVNKVSIMIATESQRLVYTTLHSVVREIIITDC